MILFSVIVPMLNVENYIEKCLTSLVNQTEKTYEVILIDNGSTDRTREICDSYAEKFPFIQTLYCEKKLGVSGARNMGLEHAKGEYILFVDSDDEISPFLVERLGRRLKQTDSELYIYDFTRVKAELAGEMEPVQAMQSFSAAETIDRLLAGDRWSGYCWNKVWMRSVIEKNHIRFDTGLRIFEDMKFMYQYLECSDSVSLCDDVLYYYRERDDSAVNTITAEKRWQQFEAIDFMRKRETEHKRERNVSKLCAMQMGFAWLYLQRVVLEKAHSGDRTKAVASFIKKYYWKTGLIFNTGQLARLCVCFLKAH